MVLVDAKVNYLKNPVGIDDDKLYFSWKIKSDNQNVMQKAYQLEIDGVYNSGKVESCESVFINFDAKDLKPQTRYTYSITVWDNYGESDKITSFFETGLKSYKNWKGTWIKKGFEGNNLASFRKEFILKKEIESARMYITALGIYKVMLNGEKVGDNFLAPGFNAVSEELLYQTYDVTSMLRDKNCVVVTLANGWTLGRIYHNQSGLTNPAFLSQIDITYKDGTKDFVSSDTSWTSYPSAWERADIYDGESYDASKENKDLYYYGNNSEDDVYAIKMIYPYMHIKSQTHEYIKKDKKVLPVELIKTPKGEDVIDFGQNLTGWVKFKVKGNKGDKVIYDHAEVLDKHGNFFIENMRSAKNLIEYTLSGEDCEEFEPSFSFQGFRYIRLLKFPGEINLNDFEAYLVHTDYEKTGYFECDNEYVNKLFQNVIWGQDDNFLDVPTDCPQRDERQGWTGDAQVFIKTAALNANVGAFFTKWLGQLAKEQRYDGLIHPVCPDVFLSENASSGWSDAICICPMEIYNAYGDTKILETLFTNMVKWVEYVRAQGDNEFLWNTGYHYGDWLSLDYLLDADSTDDKEAVKFGGTDKSLIATAFYANSAFIVSQSAKILGYTDKYIEYKNLYENIKKAYQKEFIKSDGTLISHTQTAYTLTIYFNLVDDLEPFGKNLKALIEKNGNKLSTGFLGAPYLTYALSKCGYTDLCYDLLLTEDFPSWIYPIKKGATTIWEHWDGIKENGDFWSEEMNSFNHYSYGSIVAWLYTNVAGIKYVEKGYKTFEISPQVNKKLNYVKSHYESMYGEISSSWNINGEKVDFKISVPCNTTCTFKYGDYKKAYQSGTYEITLDYIN